MANMSEQFGGSELYRDPSAEVRHFEKESEQNRDRFGNRLFLSENLAYLDRHENPTKAGILISGEGEDFLKKHSGILKKLDSCLADVDAKDFYSVAIGDEIELKRYDHGGQSNVYLLSCGEEKCIIKTHRPERETDSFDDDERTGVRIDQPYLNEMLQTQSFAKDLVDELRKLHVQMPVFLFASGQVSCTKFYLDSYQRIEENERQNLRELWDIAQSYIFEQQHQGNHLWEGVELDNPSNYRIADRNFIKTEDGTLVWIDPFVLDTTPREPGRRYLR